MPFFKLNIIKNVIKAKYGDENKFVNKNTDLTLYLLIKIMYTLCMFTYRPCLLVNWYFYDTLAKIAFPKIII